LAQAKKLSRRRFLALGCGAACAAALGSGCTSRLAADSIATACPYGKVNDPYPGACHRYADLNGSGLCDLSEPAVESSALAPDAQPAASGRTTARVATRCPYGLVNDPYPGRCGRYVDRNGNSLCDLSEADAESSALVPSSPPAASGRTTARAATRCPWGLVDDPYPGRCRRYVDRNGSRICDLSETV
jgi:hypothetical protein